MQTTNPPICFIFLLMGLGSMLLSCENHSRTKVEDGVFDANFDISVNELQSIGFELDSTGFYYEKKYTDAVITYLTIPPENYIYWKTITVYTGKADSVYVKSWLAKRGAVLISPFIKIDDRTKKFFVRAKKDGQIFTGKLVERGGFQFQLNFPGNKNQSMEKYRTINSDGSVTVAVKSGNESSEFHSD